MARVAPAWWSLWAMPQAMERLLASPKTTAVLPARLIMLSLVLHGPARWARGRATFRISAARVVRSWGSWYPTLATKTRTSQGWGTQRCLGFVLSHLSDKERREGGAPWLMVVRR